MRQADTAKDRMLIDLSISADHFYQKVTLQADKKISMYVP